MGKVAHSPKSAAKAARVNADTIIHAIRDGQLQVRKAEDRHVILHTDLMDWLNNTLPEAN